MNKKDNLDDMDYEDYEKHGTTIIGILTEDGVVLASDRKVSTHISTADKDFLKIKDINPNTLLAFAGSVADAQDIVSHLRQQANLYNARRERDLDVSTTVNILQNYMRDCFRYVSPLIGGFDDSPRLYEISPGGSSISINNYACSGSGQQFATGVLESEYKPNLTISEARELARKAIKAASERDNFTGNGITIGVIKSDDKSIETYDVIPDEI